MIDLKSIIQALNEKLSAYFFKTPYLYKKQKKMKKDIFLTYQAYDFYNADYESNKKSFINYCKQLKENGTLAGNKHGEKISFGKHKKNGASNIFCMRIIHGKLNYRYFYCYNKNNIVIFNAYAKKKNDIPSSVYQQTLKDVKELMRVESMEKFKSFEDIYNEAKKSGLILQQEMI